MVRRLAAVVAGVLLTAASVQAQQATGTISGRVVDSTSNQPLGNVTIAIPGTQRGTLTRNDGGFTLSGVPAGTVQVRAQRIGYGVKTESVAVPAGGSATVTFSLSARAASLSEVVVTGYGTQRREAITGSIATVKAEEADVGVIVNANQMLVGRVPGVQITSNSGEPGGGVQIRVRGGTSISGSNEPLYVVDGVPLQNEQTVATGLGVGGGGPTLARNPLNSLNPNDIESISVLKDASATAIYGSRGANGVVLIETKKGRAGQSQVTYEGYAGASTPSNELDFISGEDYRTFVNARISANDLPATAAENLGTASTNWQDELFRTGYTQNHDLSFAGGNQSTQFRAALNYFDQTGVVIANGLTRYQGRVNATNQALNGKLQTGVNLTASRVTNRYLPSENTGGFEGGVFTNMAVFNPTQPVYTEDGAFYEIGPGGQSTRNPVALAEQITDIAPENRVLGNVFGSMALRSDLVFRASVGGDFASSVRQTYFPIANPVGFTSNGRARQAERTLQNQNLQTLLTYTPRFSENQELEVVGGYEYSTFNNSGFAVEVTGFRTDAFTFDNLGGGNALTSPADSSYRQESKLASFFGRANYGFKNKYFLTGVLRYDGSSRLAEGNKWELFPAISGSWRLSEEDFMKDGLFSNLNLRAGWGRQGNQNVQPYQTQLLLRTNPDARYPIGGDLITGFAATQVGNDDLKWETSTQTNIGIDYGFSQNKFTGAFEFYTKTTEDLLLEVDVPQPAVVRRRIENVGEVRNRGVEFSFDANLLTSPERSFTAGLVFTVERNEVVSLGENFEFIQVSAVNGQGQSNRWAQRLLPGKPIGTFYGPQFLGFNASGQQLFACSRTAADCVSGQTIAPAADDEQVIGNANPDFAVGFRSNGRFGKFDASWLWNAQVGQDVFNNTSLIYQTTAAASQARGFLADALENQDAFREPSIYSSRWIESASFLRLQNVTVGYNFALPAGAGGRPARFYVSGDNLLLFTGYSGYDPEVYTRAGGTDVVGAASRGVDYLAYPRARTFTSGIRVQF